MADVKFEDFSVQVKGAIDDAVMQYLYEASGELVRQTARSSPVDTGELKNSWNYNIDEGKQESKIGSPIENAIWNEFGTGEFALEGNGRKGGWKYQDDKGKRHFTMGKKPQRTFKNAFDVLKPKLIKRAETVLKGRLK